MGLDLYFVVKVGNRYMNCLGCEVLVGVCVWDWACLGLWMPKVFT